MINCRRNYSISVLFFLGLLANVPAVDAETARAARHMPWPLDADIHLSSSFAEYREGHLHAGLDIRTFGREGIPCIAVGDGYISRMRAAYNGYGLALYLTLDSGETAVYAHLSEFAPALDAELVRQQQRSGQYRVDAYFEPEQFRIRRGETVGYSGSTGATAPHLHFEFRDRYQNPMNPLSHGWVVGDRRSPRVNGALWVPLDADARINGWCNKFEPTLVARDAHTYVGRDTVTIRGRVGVGAWIIDRVDGNSGRLAPYRVELSVDDELLASMEMERFSYSHTGEVELVYDMELARTKNQYFLFLFRRDGESLWNRTFRDAGRIDGAILLKRGAREVHEAVVRTIDRAGNVSVASLPFRVEAAAESISGERVTRNRSAGAGSGILEGTFFFGDLLAVDPARQPALAKALSGGVNGREVTTTVGAVGDGVVDIAGREGQPRAHVLPLRQARRAAYRFPGLGVVLETDGESLYGDSFAYLASESPDRARAASNELRPLSDPVVLGPVSLVLRRNVRLRFRVADPDSNVAVFRLDERKGVWGYETSYVATDSVETEVGAPGVYRVFADDTPPMVSTASVANRVSYGTGRTLQEVFFRIDDEGSGVDAEATEVTLGGKTVIARWDGRKNTMFAPANGIADGGRYVLRVEARDRVGNVTRYQQEIQIPAPRPGSPQGGDQ